MPKEAKAEALTQKSLTPSGIRRCRKREREFSWLREDSAELYFSKTLDDRVDVNFAGQPFNSSAPMARGAGRKLRRYYV